MSSPKAHAVLASAGSGKTTWIARQVAEAPTLRTAVTTFTVLNAERLRSRIAKEAGLVPPGTTVLTWLTFLLQDLIRPYQMTSGLPGRIEGLNFVEGRSAMYAKKSERKYWVDPRGCVYSDKISELALRYNERSGGAVFRRLRRLYERIYIDELQDLAGYDLDLVERMLVDGPPITMVGDPRQSTYSTNQGARNKRYRGAGIAGQVQAWEDLRLCSVERHAHSYRCAPAICRLADLIYPDMPTTEPRYGRESVHRGALVVRGRDVERYLEVVRPQVLRHDKNGASFGTAALNFGSAKGLEFEHVLIAPTGPIRKWLASGERRHIDKSLAKLYVAITRACHSVAFVHDGRIALTEHLTVWTGGGHSESGQLDWVTAGALVGGAERPRGGVAGLVDASPVPPPRGGAS